MVKLNPLHSVVKLSCNGLQLNIMQISSIQTTNPNLNLGLWVKHVNYPQVGAGQIQQFILHRNTYPIEHWQKPVLDGLNLNGLLYQAFHLRLAEYLYMGHYKNTLY